ncbi:MAG: TolC family protein [Pontibacterium sp.]
MTKRIFTLAPLSLAVLLAGCSVAPQPMDLQQLETRMHEDRLRMFANSPDRIEGLTLEKAIDMAINNNFELRQQMMEEAIAGRQLDLAHYDMLPELVASAGYTVRSNEALSRSVDTNGNASSTFSTSQDKDITTASLSTVWNVLDFGVSYYQAQQSADQVLISEQRRRKIVQNLVQQVRASYWNAVGAQYLQNRIEPLLEKSRVALANAEQVGEEQLMNPLDSLRYRKELLEITRQVEGLRDELSKARPELAMLMGLAPGTKLELAVPEEFTLIKPELKYTLEEMENIALSSRPELIEAHYQQRITALDTRKAMVRMLPGLEVDLGHYYNSNSFLANSDWTQGGVRISWNIFNLLRGDSDIKLAEAQEELADSQRMAMNMAVLSQVHVSWLDYQSQAREYDRARELAEIGSEIHTRMRSRQAGSVQSRMDEIKTETSALTEELRMFRAYAGLQEAYGRVKTTLGTDHHGITAGGFAVTPAPEVVTAEPEMPQVEDVVETAPVEITPTEAALNLVDRWAQAWRDQNVAAYTAEYTADYPGDESRHIRWEENRAARLSEPSYIRLELSDVNVAEIDEESARVTFTQAYTSNLYTDTVEKTLQLKRVDDAWKIAAEVSREQ